MVYFIRYGKDGPIKIGYSASPENRLAEIQSYCPEQLTLLCTLPLWAMEEKALHRRFAHLRRRYEWFEAAPELMEFIATAPGLTKAELRAITDQHPAPSAVADALRLRGPKRRRLFASAGYADAEQVA